MDQPSSLVRGLSRKLVGVFALMGVVMLWTTSSYVIKAIVGQNESERNVGPVLLTFYQQAHGIVLLLPVFFSLRKGKSLKTYVIEVFSAISLDKMARFSLLWLAAQCTFNCGVPLILVTTSSILSSFCTVFTFIFGLIVLREPFLWKSALGVLVALGGAVLTILYKPEDQNAEDSKNSPDSPATNQRLLGSALMLISAALFGLTNCLMKRWLKDERFANDVFGMLGVVSIGLAAPILAIFHATGAEAFKAPEWKYVGIMSANALLGTVLSNYLLSLALIILGPVIVSVGLTSNVLLAAVIDYMREKPVFQPLYLLGMFFVIVAVIVVSIDQTRYQREQERQLKEKLVVDTTHDLSDISQP